MKVYCYNIKDFLLEELEEKIKQFGIGTVEIDRFRNEEDRKRKLTGELLIREMIRKEGQLESDQITITRTSSGKPVFQDSGLYFNISHSGEWVYGVIDDHPVGIDVEKIRPVQSSVLDFIATEKELKNFTSDILGQKTIEDRKNLYEFFSLWTKKEAYIKCIGQTLKNIRNLKIDDDQYDFYQEINEDYLITVCRKNILET